LAIPKATGAFLRRHKEFRYRWISYFFDKPTQLADESGFMPPQRYLR